MRIMIVLVGYMGSGKSTIGRMLANQLKMSFLDLDAYIEEMEGSTISQLFASKGEVYFRKKEAFYLEEVLSTKTALVLALGGGTPCFGNNMNLVHQYTDQSFYLHTPVSVLTTRLAKEKTQRPLIAHLPCNAALIEFVGKHLFERDNFYRKANHVVQTPGQSAESVVQEITSKLLQ